MATRDRGGSWRLSGAKLYYLAEQGLAGTVTLHDLGGSGFTWFGGVIGGTLAVLFLARRHQIPVALISVVFGLTQPQLFSLALIALGTTIIARTLQVHRGVGPDVPVTA